MTLRRADQAVVPQEPPPIRVYQEALDFQRKRTPLLRKDFYARAMDEARPRAFTITGIQKMEHLLEANRLVERAIANNTTMSDFADQLGELVDDHGGTILPPSRFELIHHNAMVNMNAAGQFRQAMEFVEDRPYFRYRGPEDAKISQVCKPIHGVIVHHTDPLLRHMWQPNHHWERHEWESLAAEDVDPEEVFSSEGADYPIVNGQVARPAKGFDYNAGDVFGVDDDAFVKGAEALGEQLPAKRPTDYGLARLADVDVTSLPELGDLPDAPETADEARAAFRRVFGIRDGAKNTIVLDYANDGVWITERTLEHLIDETRDDKAFDRPRHFEALLATLRDPAEVWLVPRKRDGRTLFVKRYIGAFRDAKAKRSSTVVFIERSPEGWLMWSGRVNKARTIERYREGLLVYTKVPRKKG